MTLLETYLFLALLALFVIWWCYKPDAIDWSLKPQSGELLQSESNLQLVRELATNRFLSYSTHLEDFISKFDDVELIELPEATIVTIVESYLLLLDSGVSEKEAIKRIDDHRGKVGWRLLPTSLSLESFIEHRINGEYPPAKSRGAISKEFIFYAISRCQMHFRLGPQFIESSESRNGTLTFEQLLAKAMAYISQKGTAAEEHIARMAFLEELEVFDIWYEMLAKTLHDIADTYNKDVQIVTLRNAIMLQITKGCLSTPFVQEEFSENEKKILFRLFDKDKSYETISLGHERNSMSTEIISRCLWAILLEIDGTAKSGWFSTYYDLTAQCFGHEHRSELANENGETYADSALLERVNGKREELGTKILSGDA